MDNRILIVDDKPEVRDSMSDYMRLAGFVAESVASAEDALELLRNNLFDLVITDIVLPDCTAGDHLTLKIERNEAPAPDTHVISYCVTEA